MQPDRHQSESKDEQDSLLPGAKFLKENEFIQSQVRDQIRCLRGKPRDIGTVNFKSGLLRANANKKKVEVAWPHEVCYFGISGKNPQYEELSPFQFIFGHIGCIQEEQSQAVRDNMLEYLKLLMQDAIETNWATVKRAHSVVLQTMERGRCSWDKFEYVDRIHMRCTQRTLQPNGKANSGQKKEIICSRFNSNTCSHSGDHQEGQTWLKHACAHCFSLTKRFLNHTQSDCYKLAKNGEKKDVKN